MTLQRLHSPPQHGCGFILKKIIRGKLRKHIIGQKKQRETVHLKILQTTFDATISAMH